jgi:hypothetical protein
MSRCCVLVLVCACGLALGVTPALAREPKQRADQIKMGPDPPEILAAALKQKVEFDGQKIGALALADVLRALVKKHDITFVILEEEFKAQKRGDIKDKKSPIKHLDTKDMTVADLLDAWLPSLGATYKVHEDYIAVWPLLPKVQEPAPVLNLRKDNPEAKDVPKPAKKVDAAAEVLAVLGQPFQLRDGVNINDVPLFELLQDINKQTGVSFVINETSFKAVNQPNIKEEKPKVTATQLRGLTLQQFLTIALDSMGAVHLVRNGMIEIVSVQHAAKVTRAALTDEAEDGGLVRLKEPLVSVIIKEKPLNEVVAQIAEAHDLTVVLLPQAGDARTGFVTARLLNVPADRALELLALQCDLRVVRRGPAYLITTRDHANELFDENLEKERKKLELQRLREGPAKPAVPNPPPDKPPEPAPPPKPPAPAEKQARK